MIRQPIVTIMGHVDHGKTSVLDAIRGSAIAAREAGGITQAIGASIIPSQTLQKICGELLKKTQTVLSIPGLLFIDTPGHAAFMNLRKRGGSLADIAILVVDINDGLMPQTMESIEILKNSKTPFIIAANKIDMLQGWTLNPGMVLDSLSRQSQQVQQSFDVKLYELVGQVYDMGLQADRFDRVSDYTKQVAIVPVSAKTHEGIPELLMVLTGLTQKFLEQDLQTDVSGPAKGTVLEVKEQKGLGTVLDVILYDGTLKVGDKIIVASINGVVDSKVKALLVPAALQEIRVKQAKFDSVNTVAAANGVRVVAPGAEDALAGMRFSAVDSNYEEVQRRIESEVGYVVFDSDTDGVMVKADSVGSLEALISMLKDKGIPVRKSGIGPINKKDVSEVEATLDKDLLHSVILGFNIPKPDLQTAAKIICHDVIYQLIEDYEEWREKTKKSGELDELNALVKPCRIEILQGYVFRQSNPAVVGVSVAEGVLRSNTPMMNKEGKELTQVKAIQVEQENVEKAEKGKNVSVSLPGITVGRQLKEGDVLYSAVPEDDFRKYKEFREHLSEDEKSLLREIAEIKRKSNALWGV